MASRGKTVGQHDFGTGFDVGRMRGANDPGMRQNRTGAPDALVERNAAALQFGPGSAIDDYRRALAGKPSVEPFQVFGHVAASRLR